MLEKKIGRGWADAINPYLPDDYFEKLGKTLAQEYKTNIVYPPVEDIFNAFTFTPYKQVNIMFLSLDPYIRESQAYGVAFGVRDDCFIIPPSLRNIEREVEADIYDGFNLSFDFTLQSWCNQGIFMYNSALTVIEGKTGSHLKMWSPFTEAVMKALNDKDFCIYVLLGKVAQEYGKMLVNKDRHYIVSAPHPAAEAYAGGKAGFFGSRIFSKINQILVDNDRKQIKW
jgi:uracil-DNA glycosylase